MASLPLFRAHDPASRTRYQDLKQLALTQRRVLAGTPGTLKHRIQAGKRYWVREHIRADGSKTDEYLGAEHSLEDRRLAAAREELELAKALAAGSSTLRVFGYQRIERKTAAVLAALFNRGLFNAGLALVGSHAYGALLNELGVSAPGYRTQDVDVARAQRLEIALPEEVTFQRILTESGLPFVAIPALPSHRPSTSFKLPGAESLAVDLLVPGKDAGKTVPVEELRAFAQAIPLLDFLVREPLDAVVLSPNQVIPVKVPAPEHFLLHKLYSSQSRRADRSKIRKDLEQAAVLAAVIEQETPGRIRDAFRRIPAGARPLVRRGAEAVAKLLHAHPGAESVLVRIGAR